MPINWYPGHMVKAKREIQANMKLVDIVAILLDARAPFSCRNRDLERMSRNKQLVFILNKMDLVDAQTVSEYQKRFQEEGFLALAMDSTSGQGLRQVVQALKSLYRPIAQGMLDKGRRVRPARIMVVGVPNVGKSTFLNCLAGQKSAQTGAKPGITRGKQWVRIRDDIELMDTPGLMWPKVETEEQGLKLALLNVVGENAYEAEAVVMYLLQRLQEQDPQILTDKLGVSRTGQGPREMLAEIAVKRGHLLKAGALDLGKTCTVLLQDFRRGRLGRIGLD